MDNPQTNIEKAIVLLEQLNHQIAKQNSIGRMLVVGIVYGIGFFIGSAVIATIALGLVGPYFANIAWVRDAFITGFSLAH